MGERPPRQKTPQPFFRLDFCVFLLYHNYVGFEVKTPLEEAQELKNQGLGIIQKIYVGGSMFETWFIYTGKGSVHVGDQTLEPNDMYDLTYWSFDE